MKQFERVVTLLLEAPQGHAGRVFEFAVCLDEGGLQILAMRDALSLEQLDPHEYLSSHGRLVAAARLDRWCQRHVYLFFN